MTMTRQTKYSNVTTVEKADKFDVLMPLLFSMYGEFKELSKKKPDGALSKRKIIVVNRLLSDIHSILSDEPTSAYLDLVDETDVPQNSDVVLVLSQTVTAMNTFKSKYDCSTSKFKHIWSTELNQ